MDYSRHKRLGIFHNGCWHNKSVHRVAHLHCLWTSLLYNDFCIQVESKHFKVRQITPIICSEFYKICVCLMVGVANASSALQALITTNSRFVMLFFCSVRSSRSHNLRPSSSCSHLSGSGLS